MTLSVQTRDEAVLAWVSHRAGRPIGYRDREFECLSSWLGKHSRDWWDSSDARRAAAQVGRHVVVPAHLQLSLDQALLHVFPESHAAMDRAKTLAAQWKDGERESDKRERDRRRGRLITAVSQIMAQGLPPLKGFIPAFRSPHDESDLLTGFAMRVAEGVDQASAETILQYEEYEARRRKIEALTDDDIRTGLGKSALSMKRDVDTDTIDPRQVRRALLSQLADARAAKSTLAIPLDVALVHGYELCLNGCDGRWHLPPSWERHLGRLLTLIERELLIRARKERLPDPENAAYESIAELLPRLRNHLVRLYLADGEAADLESLDHWARKAAKHIYKEACRASRPPDLPDYDHEGPITEMGYSDEILLDLGSALGIIIDHWIACRPTAFREADGDVLRDWSGARQARLLAHMQGMPSSPESLVGLLVEDFQSWCTLEDDDRERCSLLLRESLVSLVRGWLSVVDEDGDSDGR